MLPQAPYLFRWTKHNSAAALSQTVFGKLIKATDPDIATHQDARILTINKKHEKNLLQPFAMPALLAISPLTDGAARSLLGNSSMVERRTLTPLILVRIQVPQPIFPELQ